jgi:diaminopimelate decarboxylase
MLHRERNVENGILQIGGAAADQLAKACGTPLYVYDEGMIEARLKAYKQHFRSDLFDTEVLYASKAFACKALYQLLNRYDFGLDVVSGGELFLAKESGVQMDKIYFHGNNKTDAEIEMALSYGCGTIVVDHKMECERLIEAAEKQEHQINVMIRINPGVTAHTHKYIITGDLDSKFGVMMQNEEMILSMISSINQCSQLNFQGFHSHIGSQIFDLRAYETVIERLVKFIKKCETEHKIEINCLNLGGGFGSYYTQEDQPKAIEETCETLIKKCEKEIREKEVKLKQILIEPGRSIVAEPGYTLYTIGFMKDTPNKSFLFVDGGMTDNMRVALYDAKYDCDLACRMDEEKENKYTIAGKCCESGDILIERAMLPKAESGDLLAVYATGAYGYSMSNNYNRMRKLPVVFVKNGKARMVIKGESYSDQIRLETDEEVLI